MNTPNTLDAAVEQLIQVPNTTTEDTTEEVVEASSEETIEEPQQETDVVDEAENDADDDLLDQLDADDLEDEPAAPLELSDDLEIEYKADGQMKKATLGELKRNKAGQEYIQRRMQEIAQLEKQVKEQSNALAQQRHQEMEFFEKAKKTGFTEPTPPSKDLFESDPIAFMQSKLEYDEAKAEYDTKVQQFQQLQMQQEQQQQQQLQAFTEQQTRLLTERLPDIADPEKGDAIKKDLMEVGDYYGFTQQELESVRDHRYILAMYDAMRFRKLVKKRGKATSNKESIAPVKPGAKKRLSQGKAAASKKAEAVMRAKGDIDSIANYLLNP